MALRGATGSLKLAFARGRSLSSPLNAWLCDAPPVAAKSLPNEPPPSENRQTGSR